MEQIKVYLAGDSTMCEYEPDRLPRAGWGQFLHIFLRNDVEVINKASSGRSTKSFIDEGRLEEIDEMIKPGDYLFIQFGHNDEKEDPARHTSPFSTYQQNLKAFLEVARLRNANPVFLTPVQRRSFDEEGEFVETHGLYPTAMKELAAKENVPVIDLTEITKVLLKSLGSEASKKLFLILEKGQSPNYPDGEKDNTHFSEFGAKKIAELVWEGLNDLNLSIQKSSIHI